MIVPGKFVPLSQSILNYLPIVLDRIPEDGISILHLHTKCKRTLKSIDHFLFAVDTLYILGKIDVNFNSGAIYRA